MVRRAYILVGMAAVLLAATPALGFGSSLRMSDHYSPRNRERPLRKSTRYIILHTTEGPKKGSLNKVCQNGEAHYLVDPGGRVYRIIERNRVALHAGRSMWDGLTNLDEHAIGIEVVGYHDGRITDAQFAALRALLEELKRLYGVADERVLTHSMVAYGAPNRWHPKSHRGRKRCGMLFAAPEVRRRLGLTGRPAYDPDVRAGRLVVGDPELARRLFGGARQPAMASAPGMAIRDANVISSSRSAWDIARDAYNRADTCYRFPDGTALRGDQIRDWNRMPTGTRVTVNESASEDAGEGLLEIGVHGESAMALAGDEIGRDTTIYFLANGMIRRGDELADGEAARLPKGTRMLVGYRSGGYVTARRSAFDICGAQWNSGSTFYRLADGRILTGDRLNENAVPKNTQVFFRN